MKMMKVMLGAALAAGFSIATPAAAVVSFSDLSTTGLSAPAGRVSYLSAVTPTGSGTNILTSLTFGVGVAAGTTAQTQTVFIDFYKNVNLSPTATDALASSTYVGGFGGNLTVNANTGTTTAYRAFTFSNLDTLTTPLQLLFDGSNFGVVVTLADATGQFYSTVLSGLTTTGAPTVGTAYNRIWTDTNLNGVFAGSEQATSATYAYLAFSTVAAVPEPATWGMMILGVGVIGGAARRRRTATTVRFA